MKNCLKCNAELYRNAKEPVCLKCRNNDKCECGNKKDWRAKQCKKCDSALTSERAKAQWQKLRPVMEHSIQKAAKKRKGIPIKPPVYCRMEGCGIRAEAHQLCHKHYARLKYKGSVELDYKPTAEERFWAKVDKTGDCWLWTGITNNKGYGMIGVERKHVLAHRFSLSLILGKMPDKQVLHKCDNPRCVNPDHLWEGTIQDNCRDKIAKGRHVWGSRSFNTTLTEADVAEIKRLLKTTNLFQREIAERLNTTTAVVCAINLGKTWKHVQI